MLNRKRSALQLYNHDATGLDITTDPETLPENSTTFVMTNLQGNLKKTLGDLDGLRTWVEYGFRQCKQELGWTDYRLTNFQHIERWWEIILGVYTMSSLNAPAFLLDFGQKKVFAYFFRGTNSRQHKLPQLFSQLS